MLVPSMLLRQLYTNNSLRNIDGGVRFSIKNRLQDTSLSGIDYILIQGQHVAPENITLHFGTGESLAASSISEQNPVAFPLKGTFDVECKIDALPEGRHEIGISFHTKGFGTLTFSVTDGLSIEKVDRTKIPRNNQDDYSPEAIQSRHAFVEAFAGKTLEHIKQ